MRTAFLTLAGSFGVALALQSPIHAQSADTALPVSVERIRAGLERPPSVLRPNAASAVTPTFRTEVRAPFVLESTDEAPFDPTFGLPSVGELLMNGIEGIRSAAVRYKHRRAERRARREVDDALAAFCAVRECPPPKAGR